MSKRSAVLKKGRFALLTPPQRNEYLNQLLEDMRRAASRPDPEEKAEFLLHSLRRLDTQAGDGDREAERLFSARLSQLADHLAIHDHYLAPVAEHQWLAERRKTNNSAQDPYLMASYTRPDAETYEHSFRTPFGRRSVSFRTYHSPHDGTPLVSVFTRGFPHRLQADMTAADAQEVARKLPIDDSDLGRASHADVNQALARHSTTNVPLRTPAQPQQMSRRKYAAKEPYYSHAEKSVVLYTRAKAPAKGWYEQTPFGLAIPIEGGKFMPKDSVPSVPLPRKMAREFEPHTGCLMLDVDGHARKIIDAVMRKIPDSWLVSRPDPHVTLLYGITPGKSLKSSVTSVTEGMPEVVGAKVVSVHAFEKGDNEGVPLVLLLQSSALSKANAGLREVLDYKNDFPDYKPHLTLAYVKPERIRDALKLAGKPLGGAIGLDLKRLKFGIGGKTYTITRGV